MLFPKLCFLKYFIYFSNEVDFSIYWGTHGDDKSAQHTLHLNLNSFSENGFYPFTGNVHFLVKSTYANFGTMRLPSCSTWFWKLETLHKMVPFLYSWWNKTFFSLCFWLCYVKVLIFPKVACQHYINSTQATHLLLVMLE